VKVEVENEWVEVENYIEVEEDKLEVQLLVESVEKVDLEVETE
jgi:hypothetical protein